MAPTRETANKEFVVALKKYLLWPMEWHEASARHSDSLAPCTWGRGKRPGAAKRNSHRMRPR
jgi:hypothetical protein